MKLLLAFVQMAILGVFIHQMRKQKSSIEMNHYTKVTLTFLAASRFLLILHDVIKYSRALGEDASETIQTWTLTHPKQVRLVDSFVRHVGYCLDNIAFAFCIARWHLLLTITRDPNKLQDRTAQVLMAATVVFIVTAFSFLVIEATGNLGQNLQVTFYLIQGVAFRGTLLVGYIIEIVLLRKSVDRA